MSWNLSPEELSAADATSSLWRVAQVVFEALIAAIRPSMTLAMLMQPSPRFHKRLANPKRKRRPAVNYPKWSAP
jgi:hypothetical protein